MLRRSFYLHLFDVSLALGSLFVASPAVVAQTPQPQLHQLLQALSPCLSQRGNDTQADSDPEEDQYQSQPIDLSLAVAELPATLLDSQFWHPRVLSLHDADYPSSGHSRLNTNRPSGN